MLIITSQHWRYSNSILIANLKYQNKEFTAMKILKTKNYEQNKKPKEILKIKYLKLIN